MTISLSCDKRQKAESFRVVEFPCPEAARLVLAENSPVAAPRGHRVAARKHSLKLGDLLSADSAHDAARGGGQSGVQVSARSRPGRCALSRARQQAVIGHLG
jgi:hypothetical protein